MAKQIIILAADESVKGHTAYSVAYWLTVPVARQPFYANPDATSAWKDADPTTEVSLLKSGAVVEQVDIYSKDEDEPPAQTKQHLADEWTRRQALVNARNPWDRYGTYWDGTTWTAAGVA